MDFQKQLNEWREMASLEELYARNEPATEPRKDPFVGGYDKMLPIITKQIKDLWAQWKILANKDTRVAHRAAAAEEAATLASNINTTFSSLQKLYSK